MSIVGSATARTAAQTERREGASAGAIQRPALVLFDAEPVRAAMELVRHVWSAPSSAASGDEHPVVIFPGLGAGAASLTTLLKHCRDLGYDAVDWGQGVNNGPQGELDDWLHRLADRVADLIAHHAQRATFIGWSLGGLYARELGKLLAPRLQQVITIGTPIQRRRRLHQCRLDVPRAEWQYYRYQPGFVRAPAQAATGADHLGVQPFRRRCRMADLLPCRAESARAEH